MIDKPHPQNTDLFEHKQVGFDDDGGLGCLLAWRRRRGPSCCLLSFWFFLLLVGVRVNVIALGMIDARHPLCVGEVARRVREVIQSLTLPASMYSVERWCRNYMSGCHCRHPIYAHGAWDAHKWHDAHTKKEELAKTMHDAEEARGSILKV